MTKAYEQPRDEKKQSGWGPILKFGGGLLVLLLAIGVGLAVWGTRKLQAVVQFGKQAREKVETLRREMPYDPPESIGSVSLERWLAMMDIRDRTLSAIDPAVNQAFDELLGAEDMAALMLAAGRHTDVMDQIETLLDGHVARLREQGMGPAEYAWLLGYAVHEELRDGGPVANEYRAILERAAALTRTDNDPRNDFRVEQFTSGLGKLYEGQRADVSWARARLRNGGGASRAVDLISIVPAFSAGE